MAQTAGFRFTDNSSLVGQCLSTVQSACTNLSGSYNSATGQCYKSGVGYLYIQPCLIGTVDSCPTCSTSSDSLGVNSIDSALLSYMFGSAVLFWSIGLGIGLIIAQIRKTRI